MECHNSFLGGGFFRIFWIFMPGEMILQFHEHIFQMDGKKPPTRQGGYLSSFFFFFRRVVVTLGIQSPSENGDGT